MPLRRKPKIGNVDGGEGSGVPLGGHDDRPPTGYRNVDDDSADDPVVDVDDASDAIWDDNDPADRRRDPLRRP